MGRGRAARDTDGAKAMGAQWQGTLAQLKTGSSDILGAWQFKYPPIASPPQTWTTGSARALARAFSTAFPVGSKLGKCLAERNVRREFAPEFAGVGPNCRRRPRR